MEKKNIVRNVIFALLGCLIMGYGIGYISRINLGADPFTAFENVLKNATGLTLGTVAALINAIMVVVGYLLSKKNVGVATVLFIFVSKWPIDFGYEYCYVSNNKYINILLCVVALFLIGLGAAFFIVSSLGANAYDSIVLGISDRLNKGDKFVLIKYICDGIFLIIDVIFKGPIGIGTVLSFLLIGPFVSICKKALIKIFHLELA